ncbi:hypothetical protein BpHYR1_053250 [Brachionus plicatilis]|uniref:Uncharacterized protein n=1 Tax=Brachionus plicatilis TaxID=10195 RepID=A0A3M7S2R5_BRAPC|nr:hypothetical protein BpHYR1_053250 [Brachionus plicatilis]
MNKRNIQITNMGIHAIQRVEPTEVHASVEQLEVGEVLVELALMEQLELVIVRVMGQLEDNNKKIVFCTF